MIVFELKCLQGHIFEGWFNDGKAYEDQQSSGFLTCPVCNDRCVSKIPTAFSMKTIHTEKSLSLQQDIAAISKKISAFIENNFDNVGTQFASEALKIHYGISRPRNIRGISTLEEEKTLKCEGIEFVKLPFPVSSEEEDR